MPKEYPRSRRVADQIQRILAGVIHNEVKDPRLGMVTVTTVRVSPDLRYAKVYVTLLDDEAREESVAVLNRAAGFLRSRLGDELKLRVVPELRFVYDESIERAREMESLIEKAVREDQKKHDGNEDD